jgi:hypothetical protein
MFKRYQLSTIPKDPSQSAVPRCAWGGGLAVPVASLASSTEWSLRINLFTERVTVEPAGHFLDTERRGGACQDGANDEQQQQEPA